MTENSLLSALISLQDRQLLVPDNLLAGVTPLGGMIVESHKEGWVLGHKYWRNMRIPVVCFENLSGGSLKKHSEQACIAVFNRSTDDERQSFWGMLVQDQPRKLELSEDDLEMINAQLSEAEIAAVQVKNERASVPNMAYIEARLQSAHETAESFSRSSVNTAAL